MLCISLLSLLPIVAISVVLVPPQGNNNRVIMSYGSPSSANNGYDLYSAVMEQFDGTANQEAKSNAQVYTDQMLQGPNAWRVLLQHLQKPHAETNDQFRFWCFQGLESIIERDFHRFSDADNESFRSGIMMYFRHVVPNVKLSKRTCHLAFPQAVLLPLSTSHFPIVFVC
jgi:hypothetical protein